MPDEMVRTDLSANHALNQSSEVHLSSDEFGK